MTDRPPHPTAAPPPPRRRGRRWPAIVLGGLLALCAGVALGEWQGWSLAGPLAERWLGQRLNRPVHLVDSLGQGFRLHLLGGVRLDLAQLRIDNPAEISDTPMVQARALQVRARWRDLLAWRPGTPLVLDSVSAERLSLDLRRGADGRASWQLAPATGTAPDAASPPLLTLGRLAVGSGTLRYVDAPLRVDLAARFAFQDGTAGPGPGADPARSANSSAAAGLVADADGSLQGLPLRATLRTGSTLPWLSPDATAPAVPVTLSLHAGRARLAFQGVLRDLIGQRGLQGSYQVEGPSLAAVGAPLHLTLPTTDRFAMRGQLTRDGHRWLTVVDRATIGRSRLAGAFVFDAPPGAVPLLAGHLHGPALLLQDLGPALGTRTADAPPPPHLAPGRVLPDKRFDLPSLRAMNADIAVAIDRFDFGTAALQSAAPMRGHLRLTDGLLRLDGLDAVLAQGRLTGALQLDGRTASAAWQADLQASGLVLEQWLRPVQRAGQRPYASGRIAAKAQLRGHGRSTAEWLASADGRIQLRWTQGTVSHLLVEAAGLDIAQGLGMLLRGDDDLMVDCGIADLRVAGGRVTPQRMLVDTRDSTLWVTGGLSLATEQLDLTARVQPKDWSPLALRAPLHIDGTLGAPALSLDKPALLRRAVPAALLAMISPLAAVLPLIDLGQPDPGAATGCAAAPVARAPGARPAPPTAHPGASRAPA